MARQTRRQPLDNSQPIRPGQADKTYGYARGWAENQLAQAGGGPVIFHAKRSVGITLIGFNTQVTWQNPPTYNTIGATYHNSNRRLQLPASQNGKLIRIDSYAVLTGADNRQAIRMNITVNGSPIQNGLTYAARGEAGIVEGGLQISGWNLHGSGDEYAVTVARIGTGTDPTLGDETFIAISSFA